VDYLEQLLRKTKLGRANAVFITDAQGGLIGASNDAVYAQWADSNTYTAFSGQTVVRLDGEEFLVIKYTSGYTGWNIVGLLPLSTLQQQVLHNQTTLVLIGIAGLLISFLMTILITRQIARPIERLRSAMRAAETGALDVQYTDDTFLETHELGVGFVKMLHNIDELVVKIGKSELRKKDAELSALQAQINPHFLYNTLDTINYMLLLENKPEISRMVIYLGDLLRNSIETSREVITLEEDLAFVEKYLYIQKVRFEEKLQYRIIVTEEARQCLILKLLVQPLVENAINHGVERQGGVVSITGEIGDNGKLIVTVQDNGCGIPKEKLKDLLVDEKTNDIKNQRTYIGVNNVNQRIKLFYGPEYGLAIQSGENAGTTVSIVVPAETGGRFADENTDCG
jgi:two-component system sensor histidine kinase YesM